MNLTTLPAAIFSPAKMAYIGYILLGASQRIDINFWQFVVITLAFILIQVIHDDFLRIWLNYRAIPEWDRKAWSERKQ
ncbi:MAG TPA: hypothetical protein VII92_15030 [Anaerolineae bacterium]